MRRIKASMLWPMAPQGTWRPYEDQPASLQGWGHQGCHHVPKFMLGLNSVPSYGVPGLPPLPYVICYLQDYLGELVRSLGMDITLDDVLTILDEHYNNVKALDVLNQELFQLCMVIKRQYHTGGAPVETPPGSCCIIPGMFSSGPCSWAEAWPFVQWTPQMA